MRLLGVIGFLLLLPGSVVLAQPVLPGSIIRDVDRILEQADEDPQGAIDAFTDLATRRQRSKTVMAYIVQQKAALLMREDGISQARDDILAVLEGQPVDFALPLRLMLGQAYLMLDDYRAGLAELETWADASPEADPAGLFLLGYGYLRVDDLERGVARLEEALATVEGAPRNHWIELLAYAYARAERPEDALALMRDLLSRDPSQERWWRQLASVLLLLEDIPRGTAALSIAEHVRSGNFEQRRRVARFLAHMGLPYEGAQALSSALADSDEPPTADDQLLLAEMWILAREFDAAVAALQAVQPRLPDDGKPSLILGQLYLHWERYAEAQSALEQAIRTFGENTPAQVYYLLAITHINLDAYDDAREVLPFLASDREYSAKGAQLERFIASREAEPGS